MASWYETGYSGAEREQERKELGNAPQRFWLRAGATKEVIWIDDNPFCFPEHTWRVGDEKTPYFATCTQGMAKESKEDCVGCTTRGVGKPDYTGQYTIVDVTGYVSKKDNKEHKFELNLFPAKTKVLNKLKLKKQNKGSLIGQLWSVSRGDEHSPSTGDDFDFVREVKMDELYKVVTYKGKNISKLIAEVNSGGPEATKVRKYLSHHFAIPAEGQIPEKIPTFNYVNLFAPLDAGAMKALMVGAHGFGQSAPVGGGSGRSEGGANSDDVPF